MPIPFTCPHCGARTDADERFAGQSGPCASCGQTVTIPARPLTGMPAYAPPKAKSSGGGALVVILLIVAIGSILGLLVCGALLLPAVQSAREAARRAQCQNNLKQIGLALLNYHDSFGTLPSGYLANSEGTPLHGWRTEILPFLEQQMLQQQIDMTLPWDDPANTFATGQKLTVYQCPSDGGAAGSQTSYLAVVGPGTAFPGMETTRLSDFQDGTSNTILVIEVHNTGHGWAEPHDLDISSLPNVNTAHGGGYNVLFADASVRFITIPPDQLQTYFTISDGQIPPPLP